MRDRYGSYETLGMQYADKYKGLDQRIGLLSLSGVKYMTIPKEKKIGKEQTTASDVPYGMKKVKQNGNLTLYKESLCTSIWIWIRFLHDRRTI